MDMWALLQQTNIHSECCTCTSVNTQISLLSTLDLTVCLFPLYASHQMWRSVIPLASAEEELQPIQVSSLYDIILHILHKYKAIHWRG